MEEILHQLIDGKHLIFLKGWKTIQGGAGFQDILSHPQ